jgi:hypothetical protein
MNRRYFPCRHSGPPSHYAPFSISCPGAARLRYLPILEPSRHGP